MNQQKSSIDMVNEPPHYQGFSNGAEVLDIAENLTFNAGNAVKYLARSCRIDGANKGEIMQDLDKARRYVEREIERRQIESLQDYKAKLMQDANDDTIS